MFKLLRRVKAKILSYLPKDHQKIFSEIYSANKWGSDGKRKFYSGSGSDEKYTTPYTDMVIRFIKDNNIKNVVDLGCGDFRVGNSIVTATQVNYVGVDVVKELVIYNNENFGTGNVSFKSLNIVRDKLPDGELCMVRQVLQHLSNGDIIQVLKRAKKYKYLIITEHLPNIENPVPNKDKSPDEDIRYSHGSGVYLDLPPFNQKVKELLNVEPEEHPDSKIVTFQVFN